ncbi:MAG: ABC transporter substrate-binding protein [Rhodospirillales bacterium]|jgi:phospholipid transport system substrate-binding protein|nr:ABC transporter substrate-binding protein [Rhodospirillales bacterium]
MRRRSIFLKLLILLLFISSAPTARGGQETPRQIVEEFQASLLSVMKEAEALGLKGRYTRLAPAIERAFDLPLMMRIAIGSYWNQTTADQRTRLASAFKRMSVSTLATFITGYSGERFETIGEGPGRQDVHLVKTRIVDPDGSDVALTYVAKRSAGGWDLIDVVVDAGISELAVRQSEYRLILKKRGIEGLIRALNAKADQLISP